MSRWAENGSHTLPKSYPSTKHEATPATEQREKVRGASGAAVETLPKRAKRTFSAADKLRIVKKADACLASGVRGALGAMLREEGLYSSLLTAWRAELRTNGAAGLVQRKTGRKPKLDANGPKLAELMKANAVLERRLRVATALLALQKKAHEILGIALPESDEAD